MYRREFTEALRLLSRAFDIAEARGVPRPVIVGGSAVEYYTGGELTSGDFDLVTSRNDLVGEGCSRSDFGARIDRQFVSVASTIPNCLSESSSSRGHYSRVERIETVCRW